METSMPVVPYGFGNNNNGDGFGMGGIGGILIGSLLGGGGLFGGNRGGYGGGYGYGGGSPAASAVATDIVLSPALASIQGQINGLTDQINTNQIGTQISAIDTRFSAQSDVIQNAIANLSTAQAAGNFTTLSSINGLGRDVMATENQNALQQLNSFNQLTTTTLTGFNTVGMQTATATNQIIAGQTALASALASCCCDIKEKIGSDGNMTRALITANRMEDLTTALNEARLAASQAAQTNSLLAALRVVPVV